MIIEYEKIAPNGCRPYERVAVNGMVLERDRDYLILTSSTDMGFLKMDRVTIYIENSKLIILRLAIYQIRNWFLKLFSEEEYR